jgi:hypothetical protein
MRYKQQCHIHCSPQDSGDKAGLVHQLEECLEAKLLEMLPRCSIREVGENGLSFTGTPLASLHHAPAQKMVHMQRSVLFSLSFSCCLAAGLGNVVAS